MPKQNQNHRFGATGRHPLGRVSLDDEGEIRFGIAVQSGRVLIDFGKPVHSLGLDPDQAWGLAEVLRRRSLEARSQVSAMMADKAQG